MFLCTHILQPCQKLFKVFFWARSVNFFQFFLLKLEKGARFGQFDQSCHITGRLFSYVGLQND